MVFAMRIKYFLATVAMYMELSLAFTARFPFGSEKVRGVNLGLFVSQRHEQQKYSETLVRRRLASARSTFTTLFEWALYSMIRNLKYAVSF
jgi:hypothetical protein